MKIEIENLRKIQGIGNKTMDRIYESLREKEPREIPNIKPLKLNSVNHGDCLDLMWGIEDVSVDMILVDVPYGITNVSWDSLIEFEPMWEHMKRIIKDNGAIVMTASQPFTTELIRSNKSMFKYCWVWEKTTATGHLNAKKMPMKAHEDIVIFYNKPTTYNPQKTNGHTRKVSTAKHKRNSKQTECYGEHGLTGYDSTERYPRSVLKFATDKQISKIHPTQKPVALFEYLIKTYTNKGETVLDFTSGSGTTAIAAINTNRNYILIEKEKKYVDVSIKRIQDSI